jgi:hypothetical protein
MLVATCESDGRKISVCMWIYMNVLRHHLRIGFEPSWYDLSPANSRTRWKNASLTITALRGGSVRFRCASLKGHSYFCTYPILLLPILRGAYGNDTTCAPILWSISYLDVRLSLERNSTRAGSIHWRKYLPRASQERSNIFRRVYAHGKRHLHPTRDIHAAAPPAQ